MSEPRRNITAKAKLGSKVQLPSTDWSLSFYPDYYGDKKETNKAWASASPSLMFQMNVRDDVAEHFTVNASYTVTFTEEVPDGDSTA